MSSAGPGGRAVLTDAVGCAVRTDACGCAVRTDAGGCAVRTDAGGCAVRPSARAIRTTRRLRDRIRRNEQGSAVVEFVVLAVLLLIPLVYLVMMLARVQAGSFAVSQAAREAGRAYVTADAGDRAVGRATAAARIALSDYSFEDFGRLTITCDGNPCLRPDGRVQTTATVRVPLPLVPAFVRHVIPLSVPVSATHLSTVDRFRGLP